MNIALLFLIFGLIAMKLDIDKTKLKNCQPKTKQAQKYEELFEVGGIQQDKEENDDE